MAKKKRGEWLNKLYYGDNLEVLREHLPSESVDLIYLDPPFNSNRSYNVLFKEKSGDEAHAQIEAFGDTWTWSHETESLYIEMMNGSASNKVKDALEAMRKLLGDNDVLAYLVMMTARLIELYRVLKPTGSIYLHCDPTAGHYLKIILDTIFGAENFQNEISWQRAGAKNDPHRYGRSHDVIYFYSKSRTFTWNTQYTPFDEASIAKNYTHVEPVTGRRYRRGDLTAGKSGGDVSFEWHGVLPYKGRYWAYSREKLDQMLAEGRIEFRSTGMPVYKRYLDEQPGVALQDVWTDIRLTSADKERLGYPTQKPRALLERILTASSNAGDVVLDPFCGCGTTVDAAQNLGRKWVGIDVTTLAVDLIDARLRHTYGEGIRDSYELLGIPRDLGGAQSLFKRSPFEFERWCVMMLDGQPNEKQAGDKGVDGVIRFPIDAKGNSEKILVSVKGGATNPGHVRDLVGTIQSQRAAMGVFVCMQKPTKAMIDAANHSGVYTYPVNGVKYPVVQIITVEELIAGKRPSMPATLLPYFQAKRRYDDAADQSSLF
ncbi:restriction endonuclease subunit M [Sphaerisporangium album]|uniref:Restriction endonuclease subunit M n=1 Tax=Sphaerisporangium album TaxID=509200 RepID=A0A367ELZ5_9ACTN|nr:DNA methyltransferase [Sphaerisporangium album]RCG19084.1 restriction endonuclease subunit M [Sphaerisporangium album]